MYEGVRKIYARYWRAYGGWGALWKSAYLHVALFALVLMLPFWLREPWWEQPISVIPSLIGFTLGGLALFMGFGDDGFRKMLAQQDDPNSPSSFMVISASFVHFIVVQIIALFAALLAKAWTFYYPWPEELRPLITVGRWVWGALGYGLFLYALTSALAATMSIFRIGSWYELHKQQSDEPDIK